MKFSTFLAATSLICTSNSALIQKLNNRPGHENDNLNPKALIPWPGSCPKVTTASNFIQAAYIAEAWWTVAASPFFWVDSTSACVSATYKLSENYPGYINVFNSGLAPPDNSSSIDPEKDKYQGWPRFGGEDNSGMAVAATNDATLSVCFPYPTLPDPADGNYIVFSTDNESYAYIFSCNQVDENKFRPILWIFNRDKDLASTLIQQQIDHAIDLLQYKFGWGEQAREFSASVLPMMTRGCPAIPDFTESNIE